MSQNIFTPPPNDRVYGPFRVEAAGEILENVYVKDVDDLNAIGRVVGPVLDPLLDPRDPMRATNNMEQLTATTREDLTRSLRNSAVYQNAGSWALNRFTALHERLQRPENSFLLPEETRALKLQVEQEMGPRPKFFDEYSRKLDQDLMIMDTTNMVARGLEDPEREAGEILEWRKVQAEKWNAEKTKGKERASGEMPNLHIPREANMSVGMVYTISIEDLRKDDRLWYRLHVFIYDLRHSSSHADSRSRLDAVPAQDYIGPPYFTPVDAAKLRNTMVDETSRHPLQKFLYDFFKHKMQQRLQNSGAAEDNRRLCAAVDLAPVFERAFKVKGTELAKNKGFVRLMKKRGLVLAEDDMWYGIGIGKGKGRAS